MAKASCCASRRTSPHYFLQLFKFNDENTKKHFNNVCICAVVRIPYSSSATAKKMRTHAVGSHFSAVAEEEGFEPSNRF